MSWRSDDDYGPRTKPKAKRRTSVMAVTLVVLLMLVGAAVWQTSAALSVPPKKTLIVGTNAPFAPFEFTTDQTSNNVVGFDMDLASAIANKLNMTVQVANFNDFNALLPALDAGNLDVAISAITITPDRQQLFNFSVPYYNSSQGVLISSTSKLKCSTTCTPSDFAGFTIGYQTQTTSETWVNDNLIGKVPIKGNVSVTDFTLAIQLLKVGKIDAVVVDYPVAQSSAAHDSTLKVAGNIPTGEQYGVVVKGGDPQHLLPTINKVIEKMIADGQYKQLEDKWFTQ